MSIIYSSASAENIHTTVVDGIGQPIQNAELEIYRGEEDAKGNYVTFTLAQFKSDEKGMIKGDYEEGLVPKNETVYAKFSKEGFRGFTTSGKLKPHFVMKRIYTSDSMKKILKLKGDSLVFEVKQLIAGDLSLNQHDFGSFIFENEAKLRPALRQLLLDDTIRQEAAENLAMIGVSEDLTHF